MNSIMTTLKSKVYSLCELGISAIMKVLEGPHFENYKFILSCLGQWPGQSVVQRRCIRCIIPILIISIIIPSMIKFVNSTDDLDIFFECIPMLCLHIGALFKYYIWSSNFEKMKTLFLYMKEDGEFLELDHDINIMKRYIVRVRKVTTAYSTAMFSILVLYLASPAVPKLMDIVIPLNTSRDLIYLYQTEYYVDPDEFYVPILLHAYCTVPFSVGIIVFFDNLLATYISHVCAMFMILRIYLKNLHLGMIDKHPADGEKKVYQQLVMCVKIHRNAITFSDTLESWCTRAYMVILIVNLSVITLTGMVTVMKLDQINEALKFAAFTVGSIFHLYYTSYQGQELIEHSEMVFSATYLSEWYIMPTKLQKLLIPIMLRSIDPCKITAGNIANISMDTFALVLKNAMSFFTVLRSCQ